MRQWVLNQFDHDMLDQWSGHTSMVKVFVLQLLVIVMIFSLMRHKSLQALRT